MTAAPAVGILDSKDSKIQCLETRGKPYQIAAYPDVMGAKPCRRGGNGLPNRGGYPDRLGVTCRVGGSSRVENSSGIAFPSRAGLTSLGRWDATRGNLRRRLASPGRLSCRVGGTWGNPILSPWGQVSYPDLA